MKLFENQELPSIKKFPTKNYKVLIDFKKVKRVLDTENATFAVNVEFYNDIIYCMSVSFKTSVIMTIPLLNMDKGWYFGKESTKEMLPLIRKFMMKNKIVLYDMFKYKDIMKKYKLDMKNIIDVKTMFYILFTDYAKYNSLNLLKRLYLGKNCPHIKEFEKIMQEPVSSVLAQSAMKTDYIFRLYKIFCDKIKDRQLEQLLETLSKLKVILYETHKNGIKSTNNNTVHPNFRIEENISARISTYSPNVQGMKNSFKPRDGYKFVKADLSQAEFRVMVHLSEDEELKNKLDGDEDIFLFTAKEVLGVEDRDKGKQLHYAIMYGATSYGIEKMFDTDKQGAIDIMSKYINTFPAIYKFMDRVHESAKNKDGELVNPFGRKWKFKDINSSDEKARLKAIKILFNILLKSTVSDIIHKSTVDIVDFIREKKLDARFVMNMHDEIIFEAKEDVVKYMGPIIRKKMIAVFPLVKPKIEVTDIW